MARRFDDGQLVIASHNAGKVREIADLVAPYGVDVVSAAALDLPEPEETGETFVENALLKAHAAAEALPRLPRRCVSGGRDADEEGEGEQRASGRLLRHASAQGSRRRTRGQ